MYELKLWYKYSTWYEPCHVHVSQINRVSAIRGNLWRCVSLLFISKWIQFKLRAFQLGIVIVEGISFLFLFNFKLAIRCINWKVRNIHFNYSQVFPNTFCKVCIFWQTAENQLRLHWSFDVAFLNASFVHPNDRRTFFLLSFMIWHLKNNL